MLVVVNCQTLFVIQQLQSSCIQLLKICPTTERHQAGAQVTIVMYAVIDMDQLEIGGQFKGNRIIHAVYTTMPAVRLIH